MTGAEQKFDAFAVNVANEINKVKQTKLEINTIFPIMYPNGSALVLQTSIKKTVLVGMLGITYAVEQPLNEYFLSIKTQNGIKSILLQ